ncbi:MAG: DUF4347 domain-containing protein [Leptolyngbyaceae cyanobacterium bins.349]|nr:DUF4347 domain-containing protein [Leptolyngbyaceae cyanobacterium bins.349]
MPSSSTTGNLFASLLFVDTTVPDYQTLIQEVTEGTEIYLLDPTQDAIIQITQTLSGRTDISSLHLVSHGESTKLQLGQNSLTLENLSRYTDQLRSWSQALTDDADILLYGCNVAQGDRGQAFVQTLSQLTQADVAASNDLTGNTALGGNWDLEVKNGAIESSLAIDISTRAAYNHILSTSFNSVYSIQANSFYNTVEIADLNGDGNQDLITSGGTRGLLMALGNGDGTFSTGINLGLGSVAVNDSGDLIISDFNNDGKLDISSGIQIALGNGDGTFQNSRNLSPSRYGEGVSDVTQGDFNGDSQKDLAVTLKSSGFSNIAILLGNGDGTFAPPTYSEVYYIPSAIATGDFNKDGKQDLAITHENYLSILLANGNGTFASPISYRVEADTSEVSVSDFNGDNIEDLAVTSYAYSTGSISILLGNGNGTFRNGVTQTGLDRPGNVGVADLDNDGKQDLVYTVYGGSFSNNFRVQLGRGDGTFASATTILNDSIGGETEIGIGDFNKDGKLDLAVPSNTSPGHVYIFSNTTGHGYVESIEDNDSNNILNVGATQTYTVTFSRAINASTLNPNDFGNQGSANIQIGSITQITPTTFQVPVTATSEGTVRLSISRFATITDTFGNLIIAPYADNDTLNVYRTTMVTSFEDGDFDNILTVGTTQTYTISFNQAVNASTLNANDFVNAGTAAIQIGTITQTAPVMFQVPITITSTGTLQLQIPSGATILDTVGNPVATPYLDNDILTVNPPNTAPVLNDTNDTIVNFAPIRLNAANPAGAVGTLVAQLADLTGGGGQNNILDPDNGALTGIAITAANTTNGSWFYSINNGTTWNALGSVSNTSARLLAADANTRLYFRPNAGYSGTIANGITFRAWDQTTGSNGSLVSTSTNGGSTAFSTNTDTASIRVGFAAATDFTKDGHADLLWRNQWTGAIAIWSMNGTNITGYSEIGTVAPSSGWAIVGTGDFSKDGNTDLLWRNTFTGQNAIWSMDGTTLTGYTELLSVAANSGWDVVGVGDLSNDGNTDLLWHNAWSGTVAIWSMDGTTLTGYTEVTSVPAASGWGVAGMGDFTGDSLNDIVWRNEWTGQNAIWTMNGTTVTGYTEIASVPGSSGWRIAGVGDYTQDGKADLLWQNDWTGQTLAWSMNGTSITGIIDLPSMSPTTGWSLA